ncbi:MAG: metallophosphoesterase family protein, partial [Hyphomicrobium sp.]
MSIRFIHTADWQIAKVYPRFSSELAGELTAARLSAIPRIAAIARAEGAAHVLVAGDVFDSDRLETVVLRRALEHMRAAEDIRWLLLPGNHDPARAGGIWERIARLTSPGNVTALTEAQPFEIARGAVVLPAPLVNRNPGRDPSAWMDDAITAPGVTRIGLAHGSVVGFGSEGESAVGIAPDRAKRAGLAYLALGDWHGLTEIDGATWYSGTPEPDRFPDNEPGFVLSVALDGAAPARVKPIASAAFRWMKSTVAIRSIADLTPLERQLDALGDGKRQTLLRVTL